MTLLCSFILLTSTLYGTPVPEHPRVFVQSHDLISVKEKLTAPPFNLLWQEIKLDTGALSLALEYLIENDESVGREAINKGLNLLKRGKDARALYNPLLIGACVYDWCYLLLSEAEKQQFIREFIRIAKLHPPGFPAKANTSAVVGHNSEGWLLSGQLPAGLAIYDEEPKMFEAAEALLKNKFVPIRNFHYQSHMHHQGDSYISTRFQHDIMAAWLFRRAGLEQVFSSDQQFVPYQLLYHLRPDGQQMRSGDTFDDRGRDPRKRQIALFTASYYHDPYLMTLADMNLFAEKTTEDKVFELLFRPMDIRRKPLSELPLAKYFSEPMGEMVVRTGWNMGINSNDAVVHMRIGNYFFGNHQRKDFGTFQIYYRGALAVSSGVYGGKDKRVQYGQPYWMNYYHQTSSQNGLLVYNPNLDDFEAKRPSVNDGGQYWPNHGRDHPDDLAMLLEPGNGYKMGKVIEYGFVPDSVNPVYSYITGDITAAYPPATVEKVTRTMATITTGDRDIPLVFIVYDQVISLSPEYRKSWLLHSETMPIIEENRITVVNDRAHYRSRQRYAGKLTMQSVLPTKKEIRAEKNAQSTFVKSTANKQIIVEKKEKGVESAPWTTIVAPTDSENSHEFLHVGWVTSSTSNEAAKVDFSDDRGELTIQLSGETFHLSVQQGELQLLN